MIRIFTLTLALFSAVGSFAQTKKLSLLSPDKRISLELSIKEDRLTYLISFNKKEVVQSSAMGLIVDGKMIGMASGLKILGTKTINENYPSRGIHSTATYKANTAEIGVKGAQDFNIEARVFNDGVAFRYVLSRTGASNITQDLTEFTLPENTIVWSQGDIGSYEGKYLKQDIAEIKAEQKAGPPLTLQLPDHLGYASITEAGLNDFAGMSLVAKGNRIYRANLTGSTLKTGKVETSWRVIEIGRDLNTLVNCDIVSNVSPKPDASLFPKGYHTEWIKPGMSVWSWLAGNGEVTFENMKRFSDWAGKLGIAYNLVDEGWSRWNDGGRDKWDLIHELVKYSAERKVGVWVWKAYPDRAGVPGLKSEKARKEFFKQCRDAGVVGLKIDFFDHENQEVIDFYQAALKDAAEMHLMLDFHGANKPTGESRTWPNELSREGIRGLENGTSWPAHNTTLPFTRFLAGHGDYTPFSLRGLVKGTTVTHQLATVAAYTSPFMCLAVDPEKLLEHPLKNLLTAIPVTWDETIVLPQSRIGELYLVARRSGKNWFLIALNGEVKQSLEIELSFLKNGKYSCETASDDPQFADRAILGKSLVNGKTKLKIDLQPGGGYLSKITVQ